MEDPTTANGSLSFPPVSGDNFLFAFDFVPPKAGKNPQEMLFIQASPVGHGLKVFERLKELYPDAGFTLLKNARSSFDPAGVSDTVVFHEPFLPSGFWNTDSGRKLFERNFGLIFCTLNLAGTNMLELQIHMNVLDCLRGAGQTYLSHIIDSHFMRYPLSFYRGQTSDQTYPWNIGGHAFNLPWTFLRPEEAKELFRLAAEGPGEGAIVNIGHFLGGSAIIMAKAAKTNNREKVFSFDTRRLGPPGFDAENGVEDHLVFSVTHSVEAARAWARRADTAIRLLLIDGDHSHDGCAADLNAWLPYLVPGGVVAVHDYCSEYTGVVTAVYDRVLRNDNFGGYGRIGTLFFASRNHHGGAAR